MSNIFVALVSRPGYGTNGSLLFHDGCAYAIAQRGGVQLRRLRGLENLCNRLVDEVPLKPSYFTSVKLLLEIKKTPFRERAKGV